MSCPTPTTTLAPQLSEETLRYHHDKHYAGYVAKLNELILDTPYEGQPLEDIILAADGAVYNNAAQAWNHAFYFEQLSPDPQRVPTGALADAVVRTFGSVDALRERMNREAVGLFGSGWVWLAADRQGGLVIVSGPNAGNPLRQGPRAAALHRRLGARLLHRLPQPAGRCRCGTVGPHRLEDGRRALRKTLIR